MGKITKEEVAGSLFWSGLSMSSQFGVRLLITLVLAYYLLPEHFGLVGMAGAATALVTVFADMGIGVALIQRSHDKLSSIHWYSSYWFNLFANWMAFAVMVFLVSPVAVLCFGEDQLGVLVIGLSLNLLWSPLFFIHRIILQKGMKFKQIFFANIIGSICGGVAGIMMAVNGFGVWSFVGQGITSSVIQLLVYWLMVRWHPRCQFSLNRIKDLMSFGMYDVGIRILGYAYNNLNVIIIGTLLNPVLVGYFVFARGLTIAIVDPINSFIKKVFFPFFSGIQDDVARIKRYHLAQIHYVTIIIFPFSIGMALIAHNALHLIWGNKWLGAILPIQLLAAFISVLVSGGTPAIILKSCGKIRASFILQIIRFFLIKIPLVVIAAVLYGFKGFLIALLVSQIIIFFVDFFFIRREINIRLKEVFAQIANPISATGAMLLFWLFISHVVSINAIIPLTLSVFLCGSLYLIIILGVERFHKKQFTNDETV